jgi:single-stranded-DNA-specific exonuclease
MLRNGLSLTGKNWTFRGVRKKNESLFTAFWRIREYSHDFLCSPKISDLATSILIPGIQEGGERIFHAKEKKESILIFGDFDLDGASGAATLYFSLKSIGMSATVKLPSRQDGYGLSKYVYDEAKQKGIQLLITVDCGSSNTDAIEYGNRLGIDTIITDHHSLPHILPPAVAIAHPHRGTPKDDTWDITGAGVAFFLGKYLLEQTFPRRDISEILFQLAELAVLGTVADVGKLSGQNRILTTLGLQRMKNTNHPGIRTLLQTSKTRPESLTAESIAFFLAPRLNSAGRMAHPHIALQLLLGNTNAAMELENLNIKRRDITEELYVIAEKEIKEPNNPFFMVFREEFFSGVSGLIAAKIQEKYFRPAIILSSSQKKEILTASCRGPEDFHFAKALREVSSLLQNFGGHACAAGFSIEKKNIPEFTTQFTEIVKEQREKSDLTPRILADCEAKCEDFSSHDFPKIFQAEPFGTGNPEGVFLLKNIQFSHIRTIGKTNTHLSGNIGTSTHSLPFIAFHFGEILPEERWEESFDVLVAGEIQQWKGRKQTKLKIVDIRETE